MEEKNNNSSKMFTFIMLWIPIIAYWKYIIEHRMEFNEGPFFGMCVLGLAFCSLPFFSIYTLDDILD